VEEGDNHKRFRTGKKEMNSKKKGENTKNNLIDRTP